MDILKAMIRIPLFMRTWVVLCLQHHNLDLRAFNCKIIIGSDFMLSLEAMSTCLPHLCLYSGLDELRKAGWNLAHRIMSSSAKFPTQEQSLAPIWAFLYHLQALFTRERIYLRKLQVTTKVQKTVRTSECIRIPYQLCIPPHLLLPRDVA